MRKFVSGLCCVALCIYGFCIGSFNDVRPTISAESTIPSSMRDLCTIKEIHDTVDNLKTVTDTVRIVKTKTRYKVKRVPVATHDTVHIMRPATTKDRKGEPSDTVVLPLFKFKVTVEPIE